MLSALLVTSALIAPLPCSDETAAVIVRVYDGVGISASERGEARKFTSALLDTIGIHVKWKMCGGGDVDAADCSDPPAAQELVVRLVSGNGSSTTPALLGFAYVPGVMATVLVDSIRETARRSKQVMAYLLGAVTAHELAHLVLGAHSHAVRGLMRAAWTDQDIRLGRIWKINLTADQRRAIAGSRASGNPASRNAAASDCAGC